MFPHMRLRPDIGYWFGRHGKFAGPRFGFGLLKISRACKIEV